MSIQEKLSNLLLSHEKYLSENVDGQKVLNKTLVSQHAREYNVELLTLLQSDADVKNHFFVQVKKTTIFKLENFLTFLNNRSFLPDSFTAFKQNIGLATDHENYLANNKEVVLNWAYKDCILEGGQTKDDQKRSEVFFNEVLAPDQINRLLDDKVFVNWKRHDKSGEHTVKELSENDNLIIKGNNLVVLHSLKKRFAGKVKLIYIDPPYNTGSDSFGYNDRFNHSTWLTFMKNRLEVAQHLLSQNGLLFIHIGDDEVHYLKILTDEIFGRNQFVATIPRKTRSGKSDVPYKLSQDFDWILVYTKAVSSKEKLFQRTVERKYYRSDDFPGDEWRLTDLTTQRSTIERPNSDFTLINPKNGDKYPVNSDRCWSITKDTVTAFLEKGKIVFPGDYDFLNIQTPYMRVFKSEEIELNGDGFDQGYVSTEFLNRAMDTLLKAAQNKLGTDEITELFGSKAFSYPKNELLMKVIIEYCTQRNELVLDFFSGSGTTAAVAHKMGRQYIGIEQMDYIEPVTVERLKKVVEGEQGGISESENWHGGGSFVYCELANDAEDFRKAVRKAKAAELPALLEKAKKSSFLSYRVDGEKFHGFETLGTEEQRPLLIELVDANTLYINYTDIESTDYNINKADKELNRQFYRRQP